MRALFRGQLPGVLSLITLEGGFLENNASILILLENRSNLRTVPTIVDKGCAYFLADATPAVVIIMSQRYLHM